MNFADRKIDAHVKRTSQRPLATGRIKSKEALTLFAVLMLLAFALVLFTNNMTIMMSLGGLFLASLYPFMKRHTHLPQVVLGAAFGWAIPMAFTAVNESIPTIAWLIYIAKILWTVAYDTMYAMVDRDDDIKIGVKSTAILFGDLDKNHHRNFAANHATYLVLSRRATADEQPLFHRSNISGGALLLPTSVNQKQRSRSLL